jgi:hypothetical protein
MNRQLILNGLGYRYNYQNGEKKQFKVSIYKSSNRISIFKISGNQIKIDEKFGLLSP